MYPGAYPQFVAQWPCPGIASVDHAGNWFPEYANHSYARVRDFTTGTVVANITTSIGFGFLNAFADYDHGRLWLFGTPADRCHGNCGACNGASCPGRPSCTSIQSWWTSESIPTSFDTAVAIPAGTKDLPHTYNQVGFFPHAAKLYISCALCSCTLRCCCARPRESPVCESRVLGCHLMDM